jgi:hypothetical protein
VTRQNAHGDDARSALGKDGRREDLQECMLLVHVCFGRRAYDDVVHDVDNEIVDERCDCVQRCERRGMFCGCRIRRMDGRRGEKSSL